MDVYLVPIARDRFECYFEAADDDEPAAPHEGAPHERQGVFARMRARFAAQLREAEHARHHTVKGESHGMPARLQRRMMRWIAERVAEQRLLWHLGRVEAATLHAPDNMAAAEADKLVRAELKRDTDRHLRLLAVHAVALIVSVPVMLLPGPNVIGYFFTFTTAGHFLSWRGARRGLSAVKWQVVPSADMAEVGRALSLDPDARHDVLCAVAERLHLRRLATFVERMVAPAA